jgi:hypothetical protein
MGGGEAEQTVSDSNKQSPIADLEHRFLNILITDCADL